MLAAYKLLLEYDCNCLNNNKWSGLFVYYLIFSSINLNIFYNVSVINIAFQYSCVDPIFLCLIYVYNKFPNNTVMVFLQLLSLQLLLCKYAYFIFNNS